MHSDAVIIPCSPLRAFIVQHRTELRDFYLDVARELARATGPEFPYGRKQGPNSLLIRKNADPHLSMIIGAIADALPEYAFSGVELWFGGGHVIPEHNDALLFMKAGRVLHLQFWVLLEACIRGDGQCLDSEQKDALECLIPAAPGPKIVELEDVLTPSGFVKHHPQEIVGGDALSIGDMLLFRNGVIHRKPRPRRRDIFRVALAMRCVRSADQAIADDQFLVWLKRYLADHASVAAMLRASRNEYVRELLDLTQDVADRDLELISFAKGDPHDYDSLTQRLTALDIAARNRVTTTSKVNYLSSF